MPFSDSAERAPIGRSGCDLRTARGVAWKFALPIGYRVQVPDESLQTAADASPNFAFLTGQSSALLQAALSAERNVFADPVSALMRLRQFGELLAQETAATAGVYFDRDDRQTDLLRRLADCGALPRDVADLFHELRRVGNDATHHGHGTRRESLHLLKVARALAVWFQKTVRNQPHLKVGKFVPPPDPAEHDAILEAELGRLRQALVEATAEAASQAMTAEEEAARRREAEVAQEQAYADLEAALELAEQTEADAATAEQAWQARLDELQAAAEQSTPQQMEAFVERAQAAAEPEELDLDEASTRELIDAQLRDFDWEADTAVLSYANGARPAKGRRLAISEWPTSSGPADYVLFDGLVPLAVVEAKRRAKDVAGSIEQAKRYSRNYVFQADESVPGGPWGEYKIPFLFATNGRPYLRQLRTKSGIWFLDARRETNHPDALESWYTPDGLRALLAQDHAAAEAALKTEPTDYLGLRDYQVDAIHAVEDAIRDGQREILLAMATGTGKTRTALGLIYRLIKAKRFRRVLFLVDRTALGDQAVGAFKNVKLEHLKSFHEIYDLKGLGDGEPEPDTRLHVATVQAMVRNLLYRDDDEGRLRPIPADRYDCILVDESHRGYNLDREMSEGEIQFRSLGDYVSKYRRVLEHFDAVRIGLTATPALHTTEIFGAPIYQYSYRQAVVDGFLVDHEPPIRIRTELNEAGIHWAVGEEVPVYETKTGQLDLYQTPDEIDIEIEGFNTKVITEPFNQVVCDALAAEIDPSLPGKTLVFCATDSHADLVVSLLKAAFAARYGEIADDAVQKITGAADKPDQKLRHYKNEANPRVAVTVDLLTTGIDVPEIVNLVFIRRVKSRILYEQMLGRATRLCPEIDKEFFRIFDAVDLYAALEDYSTMKPVVTRPSFTFAQLAEEIVRVEDDEHVRAVAEELLVKFHRRKRRITGDAEGDFEALAGCDPNAFAELLREADAPTIRTFFAAHERLSPFLDGLPSPRPRRVYISDHEDALVGTERGYGDAARPEDYLDGFKRYLAEHGNDLPALLVVTQRPRELTRAQLKELALALDEAGYNVSHLRAAWSEVTNQDIAASLIGFIRQHAIGSPLVPFEKRVDRALETILARRSWTQPQKKWLERIASQIRQETIVDRDALDTGEFRAQGGYTRLNKIFDGQLELVLRDLHEALWNDRKESA